MKITPFSLFCGLEACGNPNFLRLTLSETNHELKALQILDLEGLEERHDKAKNNLP